MQNSNVISFYKNKDFSEHLKILYRLNCAQAEVIHYLKNEPLGSPSMKNLSNDNKVLCALINELERQVYDKFLDKEVLIGYQLSMCYENAQVQFKYVYSSTADSLYNDGASYERA